MASRRLRLGLTALCVASLVGLLAGPAADAAGTYVPLSPSPCGTIDADDGQPHQINHVVWVVFENKPTSVVFGDPSKDPYLGGLALACGRTSGYLSTPYYPAKMAMVSGQDWGLTTDAQVMSGPDLFSQLGTDWQVYMGAMPSNCYGSNLKDKTYLDRHNPAYFFTDARSACLTQDVPLPSAPSALDLSHPFTWIEANTPQSMHGCSKLCGKNKWAQLAMGDTWARTWVAGILQSPQYLAGDTAVFIVWDQGSTKDNRTSLVVVSPYTTPGSVSAVPYTHYSLLRGTEDLLGLEPLGHAADPTTNSVATDFGLPFPAVPSQTP